MIFDDGVKLIISTAILALDNQENQIRRIKPKNFSFIIFYASKQQRIFLSFLHFVLFSVWFLETH